MKETKKTYTCAICGAEYDSPLERARCEIACEEKAAEETERARRAKFDKERDERKQQILEAFDALNDMCNAFSDDYDTDVSVSLELEDGSDCECDSLSDFARIWDELDGSPVSILARAAAGLHPHRFSW